MLTDQPPAYTVALQEDTTGPFDHHRRPSPETYVRICPHQKLFFDRFHQIVHLPNIHNAAHLDALVKLPTAHHDQKVHHLRQCATGMGGRHGTLQPVMYASFRYAPSSNLGRAAGFELLARCFFILRHDSAEKKSKDSIKQFLANANVWVCPHFRLDDAWVVGALFGLFHPGERYDDPLEQYRAEQTGGDDTLRCGDCQTAVRVARMRRLDGLEEYKVVTTRFLGQGQSADDASWLAQCALKRNEAPTTPEGQRSGKQKKSCCVM